MSAPNQPIDPKEENQSVDASGQPEETTGQPELEEDLAAQLEQAQAQVAQYYDELLRAKAEVENIRRRAQEDVVKARKFGTEAFARSEERRVGKERRCRGARY